MLAWTEFLHRLGIWILLIFLATLIGCYLPEWILRQRDWKEESDVERGELTIEHSERNEVAMSYLMTFSAGVCLAVAFVFEINGFTTIISESSSLSGGCMKAGVITCATFNFFFVIEQVGSALKDWHTRNCEGIAPCAIEVASAPLEAANVVRALCEHSNVRREALKGYVPGSGLQRNISQTAPAIVGDLSAPLVVQVDAAPADSSAFSGFRGPTSASCNYCEANNNESIRVMAINVEKSNSVLAFLLILFGIHSLTEGLGLGAAATPTSSGQAHAIALAILLHKTLSAFAVGASLLRAQVSCKRFFTVSCLFAAMSPLGALVGFTVCRNEKSELASQLNGWFSLIAAGTFLFVSLVELLPTSFKEGYQSKWSIRERVMKIVLFCAGTAAVFATMGWEA